MKNTITDQYKKPTDYPAKKEETKVQAVLCTSTHVEPRKDITINGSLHAGVVTHACTLEQKHVGKCVCTCEKTWQRFTDVP